MRRFPAGDVRLKCCSAIARASGTLMVCLIRANLAGERRRRGAVTMAEENWQQARLIPTSGINGSEEAERRATSALLAVVGAVREFGAALIRPFGAPAGRIETYIEVPFKHGEGTVSPDGLIRTGRGGKSWTLLV